MTVPTDDRVVYVVAPYAYDFLIAQKVLAMTRSNETVWIRTGDTSSFEGMTSTNAIVWLFGYWTRGVVPSVLETFGRALEVVKDSGVLVDTF